MKANSNRVKGKNFRNFAGKPLYCWILETLLSIESISEIIINTDAYDILQKNELLNNDKIRLIERPTEICGDEVSMNKIISHDLINSDGDIYLMTHTTNPLLTSNTISSCIDEFLDKTLITDYDSLFTVNEIQTRFYNKKGKPINHNPKKLIPTQDLEKIYEENCVRCHGDHGQGSFKNYYPVIAGQNYHYLLRQFLWIKEGKRRNANPEMVEQIARFSERDILAVMDWVSRQTMRPGDWDPNK